MSFRGRQTKSLSDVPTRESLYAEMKLMRKFDAANVFKYSTISTFDGNTFVLNGQDNDLPLKFYNQSIHCVLEHEIKMCAVASRSNCNFTEALPVATDVLRINYGGNVPTTFIATLKFAEKIFKVHGAMYKLSVGLERKLQQPSDICDNVTQLKLCDANKCLQTHYWYIRCFFNDDDDFIFRVSFQRHIDPSTFGETNVENLLDGTINSKVNLNKYASRNKTTIIRKIIGCGTKTINPYTMNITCIDPYIEPDQFVVVSDLLLKYYKTQHLMHRGKIRPTFMNIQAIRDLTTEQKMLLATMELIEFDADTLIR